VVAPAAGCGATVTFPCGLYAATNGTQLDSSTCAQVCSAIGTTNPCYLYQTVAVGGSAFITCGPCATGRRPASLAPARPTAASGHVGAWLAAAAHLEAASVPAFEQLADALAFHGAPRGLVGRARAAARDEVRHAKVMSDLAQRRGACAPAVELGRARRASLERLATENAIEGCVRETYGALLATWQAANATDPAIGSAMTRIARDETRHAALAWAIHEWASSELSPAQRRRVERARKAAARALVQELRDEPADVAKREAGLPDARVAIALARSLDRALAAA
jgi:hypothetical protein